MIFDILKRKEIYHGKVFNVQQVDLRMPDGRERTYDLVDHRDSVSAIPVDDEGNIWFVCQYRLGSESLLLELPAGVAEEGEDPDACVERELREEIGQGAAQMVKLGSFYLAAGYSSECMHIYLARGLYPAPLDKDEDEFLKLEKIPIHLVYQMAESGQFNDCKTLAALLLAHPHLVEAT